MSALLGTPHFAPPEIAASTEWPIPQVYIGNAQQTLQALETLRAVLGGGRLRLTSLWRSPSANAQLDDAASNSRHLTAQAVDFVPLDISLAEAARRFARAAQAGAVAPFDQFLVEGDHIHYDPGGAYGHRNEALVQVAAHWAPLTDWVQAHPAASGVAALAAFRVAGAAPDEGAR